MKVADALNAGYVVADVRWTQGYVSRRPPPVAERNVYVAGGDRKGQLYYMEPSYHSTQYCHRVYLVKA
jgi:hypothetical protein